MLNLIRKTSFKRINAFMLMLLMVVTTLFSTYPQPLNVQASTSGITVHMYKPSDWNSPYMYFYQDEQSDYSWPGVPMVSEGNGWYKYTITTKTRPQVLFSDNGSKQIPGAGQPGMLVTQESWYKNGTWTTQNPDAPAVVTSLQINGTLEFTINNKTTLQVLATYSDNTTKLVNATWSITNGTDNINLSATTGTSVDVTGKAVGTAVVTATFDGKSASASINVKAAPVVTTGITVHFKSTWSGANIYYWLPTPTGSATTTGWPGISMTAEGDGWYRYSFPNSTAINLIFNYSGAQTADLSRTAGEWWYINGTWLDKDPNVDVEAPTLTSTPKTGNHEASSINVTLVATDNKDNNPKIYYTLNGATPTVSSTLYTSAINLTADTTILAIAVDNSGNVSQVYTLPFHLNTDATAPVVTPSVAAGRYDTTQYVTLSVTDNRDPSPKVYYTTDGTAPVAESRYLYRGETITISHSTNLMVLAIDNKDNFNLVSFPYGIQTSSDKTDPREDTIYFVMTTRFYDGDSSNNVHCWDDAQAGNPDSDPAWRGDFEGLEQKLDYIKALGFNAVWITPVVKNASGYDYHGYHAVNFKEVDPRYATSTLTAQQSYQKLIDAAHAKGMKIIQDIVLNHTSNFGEENLYPMFNVDTTKATAEQAVTRIANGKLPANYESLTPALQYQARIAAMKENVNDTENIFHHEKSLSWESYTVQTGQIAGDCVDLNTENPIVQNYLVDAFTKYIDMGVDGFRIDTVKHISRLTFNNAFNKQFKEAGGENFFMFGEVCTRYRDVWNSGLPCISTPFYTWMENKTYAWGSRLVNEASVLQNWADNSSTSNQPTSNNTFLNGNTYHAPDWSMRSGLDVIDFPMHWAFGDAREAFRTAVGGDKYYNDATFNVTYVDSHDYAPDNAPENQRFAGTQDTWAENLSLIFTFRGIPCIYYGSEIEFQKGKVIDVGPNAPLSQTGRAYFGDHITGSVNVSDFGYYSNATGAMADTLNYPLAKHITRLNQIRRAVPALQKGQYSVEGISGSELAFKRRFTDATTDSFVLVTVSGTATFSGIPNGTYIDCVTGTVKTVTNGTLTADCSGKGNMRAYVLNTNLTSAPGKVGVNGTYIK